MEQHRGRRRSLELDPRKILGAAIARSGVSEDVPSDGTVRSPASKKVLGDG
jgi:hypothetical protein